MKTNEVMKCVLTFSAAVCVCSLASQGMYPLVKGLLISVSIISGVSSALVLIKLNK
jgi:hypothetical protein